MFSLVRFWKEYLALKFGVYYISRMDTRFYVAAIHLDTGKKFKFRPCCLFVFLCDIADIFIIDEITVVVEQFGRISNLN